MLPPLKTPIWENLSGIGQSNRPRLHAAHRKTGHRPVGLVGNGAVVGIDIRNQVVNENPFESAEVESASTRATRATRWRTCRCTAWSTHWRRTSGRRARSACGRSRRASDITAIFHHDDERFGFALGEQVVHNQAGMALAAPTRLVFACAVLQIEHGEAFFGFAIVLRRRVNVSSDEPSCCFWKSSELPAPGREARS